VRRLARIAVGARPTAGADLWAPLRMCGFLACSDSDELAPPPQAVAPADSAESNVVSAPSSRQGDGSFNPEEVDDKGFHANPFQKRPKAAGGGGDSDSDSDDEKDKVGGEGSDREIKPKFTIRIREADSEAASPVSPDITTSLKGLSLAVVRESLLPAPRTLS